MKTDTVTPSQSKIVLMAAAALILATAAVYYQTASFGFINYDDDAYVYENPHVLDGLTLNGLKWAFTTNHAGNWHPLTWISHMADVELFGPNPGMHHIVNVFFHMVNTVLLLFMLFQMTQAPWKSALVAALFALHPIHVESVAWISERKDVLSTMFWFLTILFYARAVTQSKKAGYYSSLICFTAGLMAKPMLVTTPVLLLILDFWPLNRFPQKWRIAPLIRLIQEKIPFFMISGISSIITILVQEQKGFVRTLGELPVFIRIQNAFVSYAAYIAKTVVPLNMAVLYPHPRYFPYWKWIGALVILAAVTGFVIHKRKSDPYLPAGWAWYLVTLLPVIGIIQVGSQAMADRYAYVSIIGFFIMAVWGAPRLTPSESRLRRIGPGIALLIVTAYALTAWMQVSYWRNGETLFARTVQVTENNHMAHTNLGNALVAEKQYEEANLHYREAIRINPNYPDAYNNLGVVLYRRQEFGEAARLFQKALEINPSGLNVLKNLRLVETALTEVNASISVLEDELAERKNPEKLYSKIGLLYFQKGDLTQAADYYQKAVSAQTDTVSSMIKLATIYERLGNPEKALDYLKQAVRIYPGDPSLHYRAAALLAVMKRPGESFAHLKKAFECGFKNISRLRADKRFESVKHANAYAPLKRIFK